MAEKIREFEGLLDLFEKHFALLARAIEVGDTARAPVHIVSQELHFPLDSVHLDQSTHPAHALRVFIFVGSCSRENDFLVGKNLRIRDFAAFDDLEFVAAFGAADSEDTPQEESVEMGEIAVGLVENNNLPGLLKAACTNPSHSA